MKEFNAKTNILTNLQHFELSQFSSNAHSEKCLQCILLMPERYVTDILKMCMKKFNAEKIIFDKFTGF